MQWVQVSQIRKRLVRLVDYVIGELDPREMYTVNGGKLEEFCELLESVICGPQSKLYSSKEPKPPSIALPKPQPQQTPLVSITPQTITTHEQSSQSQTYTFPSSNLLLKNSTITYGENMFLIIGGAADKNKKSPNISAFVPHAGKLKKIAQLEYGVSSHACVRFQEWFYVVGGIKDQGVITANVTRLGIGDLGVQQEVVSGLNYPSSAHAVVNWNNTHIYKIGGMGDCFDNEGCSPYIERYCPENDFWEIINPKIRSQFNWIRMTGWPLAYVSQKDQIVVLGGWDAESKPRTEAWVMQVDEEHEIIKWGRASMPPGGFHHNSYISQHDRITALQVRYPLSTTLIHIPIR